MNRDKVTIKIPRPIYNRIKSIIKESGFSSVNEFIVYVLRDLISMKNTDKSELTKEEIEAIRQRLPSIFKKCLISIQKITL